MSVLHMAETIEKLDFSRKISKNDLLNVLKKGNIKDPYLRLDEDVGLPPPGS